MPDSESGLRLEIGHVLFIDLVGYSKLVIEEQKKRLRQLTEIVLAAPQVREASDEHLVRLPTGDGMALVFRQSAEEAARCALEIAQALKLHPEIPTRMGVHSGPVSNVTDLNGRTNIAGAGINVAQRVMDCGDAGHILLSKHVAEDLEQYGHWRPQLHDLGDCEVKHGVRLGLVNLYADEVGNPELPKKLEALRHRKRIRWLAAAALVLALAAAAWLLLFMRKPLPRAIAAGEKSIAVLPFENLSSDKENAYFADGVQDEILTNLAKIADLKVISRTSVKQYKTGAARNLREIGQQLGVAHLLEGSVQRAGKQVRVNAQLIEARTDTHEWAEKYDRPLDDLFAIQSEIAKTIADQLQAKLSPIEKSAIEKPATTDLLAHDLYLRAATLVDDSTAFANQKENFPRAQAFLDEAVKRDPNFLLAWCLLAQIHGRQYLSGVDSTPARLEQAHAAVQTALRIQPDSGEAHLALARYYYQGFRDYVRARRELAIAQRTLPNNADLFALTAYIARREGQWEESSRNLERSLELDPRNFNTVQQATRSYRYQHRFADELRMWDRALSITPGHPYSRMQKATVAFCAEADFGPYDSVLAALVAENPTIEWELQDPNVIASKRSPAAAARFLATYPREGRQTSTGHYSFAFQEGRVAHWQGDKAKAETALKAARAETETILEKNPDNAFQLSILSFIDAFLGRKEDALRAARRACEITPVSKDAVHGSDLAGNLAEVYAVVGEKDLAIEQIEAVLRSPNLLHYGYLKLHPDWDSLRGDPRFERILDSLAPKK